MRDISDRKEALLAIAEQEKISLYQRFTESEASAILGISVQTLRRIRDRGEIAYLRVSERHISFFGIHLCEYLLSKVEEVSCRVTQSKNSNLETSGSVNVKKGQAHGSEHGMMRNQDKLDALASARRILNKPKNR